MSLLDTDRILTEESIKSYGFFKRAYRDDYMYIKVIRNNKHDGYKIAYFDFNSKILTKIIILSDRRITKEVKVNDIDDLIGHMLTF